MKTLRIATIVLICLPLSSCGAVYSYNLAKQSSQKTEAQEKLLHMCRDGVMEACTEIASPPILSVH